MPEKIIDHPGDDTPFHTEIGEDGAEWGTIPNQEGRFLIKPAEGKTPADYGIKGKDGAAKVRRAAVAKALKGLSPENAEAWDKDGKPSVAHLQKMLDDEAVSREDVDALAPGLTREKLAAEAASKPSRSGRNSTK